MMRSYYISLDLEGFTGISHARQAFPQHASDFHGFQMALKQMKTTLHQLFDCLDSSAPCRVLMNDAHASMTNLFLSDWRLPPQVELISGKPKAYGMMAGLDASFDATILLGYHAKAGALHAPLAHTFTDDVADLQINGVSLGEAGLSILLSELGYGVPVLLTYGDDALAQELEALHAQGLYLSAGTHVTSKKGRGWQCIQGIPDAEAHLAEVFQQLISMQSRPSADFERSSCWGDEPLPLDVVIQFHSPLVADVVSLLPLSERVTGTQVRLPKAPLQVCRDLSAQIKYVYQSIQCAYSLAAYAKSC
jgi:D-amino peptidase